MIEIERKFLISSDQFKQHATTKTRIVQGFLNTHADRTVRVRIKGEQGYITIKGRSNTSGTTRFEWEKEIPLKEAEALLTLCDSSRRLPVFSTSQSPACSWMVGCVPLHTISSTV